MHIHAEITVPLQKEADTIKKLEVIQKEAVRSGDYSVSWSYFRKSLRIADMETGLIRYVEQVSFTVRVDFITKLDLLDGKMKGLIRLQKMESKKYNWLKYVTAWDTESVLAIAIRYGYISRVRAVEERITSTDDYLRGILTRTDPFPIASADREKARKVIAWANGLEESPDEIEHKFFNPAYKGNVGIDSFGDVALMPVVFLAKNHNHY